MRFKTRSIFLSEKINALKPSLHLSSQGGHLISFQRVNWESHRCTCGISAFARQAATSQHLPLPAPVICSPFAHKSSIVPRGPSPRASSPFLAGPGFFHTPPQSLLPSSYRETLENRLRAKIVTNIEFCLVKKINFTSITPRSGKIHSQQCQPAISNSTWKHGNS